MKKAIWKIIIGLSLAVILIFGFYAYFYYSVKTMYITQTLAKGIEVTSEKREITFEKPLKAEKQIQEIALSIDGYKPDIGEADMNIKLDDGTILEPEIELVDENNNTHQLKSSGQTFKGEEVLVSFREKNKSFEKIAYKAVRIRSNKSFRCSVYWKDYDLK
jgi:hypothetical protein